MSNESKPQHGKRQASHGGRQPKKRFSEMPYMSEESQKAEARIRGDRLPPVFNSFGVSEPYDKWERKLLAREAREAGTTARVFGVDE